MTEVRKTAWAEAKNNGEFICVETYSGYRSSTRDPQGKQHLLCPSVGDQELGAAVLDSLAHSRFVPPQEDIALFDSDLVSKRYLEWVNNLMTIYGYKTKRALFKNMKNCNITCRDGLITMGPSHHEQLEAWSGDGISKEDYVVIPSDSPPADVGAALRLAFSRCT